MKNEKKKETLLISSGYDVFFFFLSLIASVYFLFVCLFCFRGPIRLVYIPLQADGAGHIWG